MLTLSEMRWLIYRSSGYCRNWCSHNSMACLLPDKKHCPLYSSKQDLQDAAEFEARVAAKLANPIWAVCWNSDSCLEFGGHKDRWVWDCEWCRLKHARLQVEKEMDAEMDN